MQPARPPAMAIATDLTRSRPRPRRIAAAAVAVCLHLLMLSPSRAEVDYASLPPTVFAPGGRLQGVERVAREALLVDVGGGDFAVDEGTSCGVLALRCGGGGGGGERGGKPGGQEGEGEFAVMAGIGAVSPSLHRSELLIAGPSDATEPYIPLEVDEATVDLGLICPPLSILSPSLVVGAGGKAVDASILLRRAIETALSMYAAENGGVEWFASHSLEGVEDAGIGVEGSEGEGDVLEGGAAGVDVTSLARRVADMAQRSTQSLGGRYGRMLSSSLLAVGERSPSDVDGDSLILWRVDPTGQFWRVDAAAVGRGALDAESELQTRVRRWKSKKADWEHDNELECAVRHEDVRAYLGSLTPDEAVQVATDCLVEGIMRRSKIGKVVNDPKVEEILARDLRKRIQAVTIRSNRFRQSKLPIEIY
ncbi:hypothetical protein ACHAWF_012453 [Thalassiosira exigua]